MKIVDNRKSKTAFQCLNKGDWFEFNNLIYIKITDILIDNNALCFYEDGDYGYANFDFDIEVQPVNVELHINYR